MKVKAFSIHTHNGKKFYPGQEMDMTHAEKQKYESLVLGARQQATEQEKGVLPKDVAATDAASTKKA